FESPFSSAGGYLRRPHGVADTAGVGDIADAAEDDRTCLALALARLRGDAAHCLNARAAIDNDHIAGTGKVVGFKLGHLVLVAARGLVNMFALHDVAHGERR